MTYDDITKYLFGLRRFGSTYGVQRERILLQKLHNPEKDLKIIHIAGTNGKGSVCAYMEGILRKQGYKTGLFTSPHLVKVNERIKINNKSIDDDTFIKAFEMVAAAARKIEAEGNEPPAFFDYIMAMAMLIFKEENVDYVILETGLGGGKDSTRAVESVLLSVITSISLDHTDILGDTIEQIAAEKAGIIRDNTPVVAWCKDDRVQKIMCDEAKKHNSVLYKLLPHDIEICGSGAKNIDFSIKNQYYKNSVFHLNTPALYQAENCSVALLSIAVLDKDGQFDKELIKEAVADTVWSGRMELLPEGIYVDGAHNADGISRFLETARNMQASKKYLIFSAVKEKDYREMIRNICRAGIFDGYILTTLNTYRALDISAIVSEFEKWNGRIIGVAADSAEAVRTALDIKGEKDAVFACGSLYLAGEIMAHRV